MKRRRNRRDDATFEKRELRSTQTFVNKEINTQRAGKVQGPQGSGQGPALTGGQNSTGNY